MGRYAILSASFFLLGTGVFSYDKFHFTNEASGWKCPGMSWQCVSPSVCARDNTTNSYVCCDGGPNAVCWTGPTTCSGSNDKTPGSDQIGCSSGDNAFCCVKQREECTQTTGQINICWERETDPFAATGMSKALINDTFSSLSSAHPSASTLSVDPATLVASSTTTSSSASSATASESANTSGASTTPTSGSDSSSGTSGGTIAGAVVGAVAGIALIAGGLFYLLRRRRQTSMSKTTELDGSSNPYVGNHVYEAVPPQEKYGHEDTLEAPTNYAPQELAANSVPPVEMEGSAAGSAVRSSRRSTREAV